MALGHRPGDEPDERFNMAVMGLRLAGRSNAVAKLHGEVSREMFSDLWPDVPTDEVPITSITNGVHAGTWVAPEMADLLTQHVLPEWHEADAERWARILEAHDDELWRAREQGREALVAFVRSRGSALSSWHGGSAPATWSGPTRCSTRARSRSASPAASPPTSAPPCCCRNPTASSGCCCRATGRCSSCSRASRTRPTTRGKELIRQISAFAADPEVRHRFVFVEDYDIAVARALLQGADVWLNNPRRPQEACGTSGMKAALNGGLNLSILDGWWDEGFDGENGWAISSAEHLDDLERRDEVEAGSLFELLERQVVPLFYERWQGPVPRRWVQRVKHSLVTLGPFVTAARMVRDYTEQLYEPTAAQGDKLRADGYAAARRLAEWKATVDAAWPGVHVDHVELDDSLADARHRAGRGGDRRAGRPRSRRRRGAAAPRPGRPGAGARPRRRSWCSRRRGRPTTATCATAAASPASRPAATASRSGSCRPTPRS